MIFFSLIIYKWKFQITLCSLLSLEWPSKLSIMKMMSGLVEIGTVVFKVKLISMHLYLKQVTVDLLLKTNGIHLGLLVDPMVLLHRPQQVTLVLQLLVWLTLLVKLPLVCHMLLEKLQLLDKLKYYIVNQLLLKLKNYTQNLLLQERSFLNLLLLKELFNNQSLNKE